MPFPRRLSVALFIASLVLTGQSNEPEDSPPYTVLYQEHEHNTSVITFSCMRPEDGQPVKTAFYLRNGVIENTDDSCLRGKSINGHHQMYVTPECEGYFMCATMQIVKNDGHKHIVVSAPLPVYARPLETRANNDGNEVIVGFEGASVTLPSPFRIHALNSTKVSWYKIVGNSHLLLPEHANKDYSLTLTNLTKEDAGIYYATATSNAHPEWSSLNSTHVSLSINQESDTSSDWTLGLTGILALAVAMESLVIFTLALRKVQPVPKQKNLQLKYAVKELIRELRQRPTLDDGLNKILRYWQSVLLDAPVTQNVFMAEVASQMLSNWDMFGMMVEVPTATLDAIRADCPHHSEKCFIRVFQEWQNNANKPFVWWTVLDILDQPPINERNLANRLCEKLLDELED